MRDFTIAIYRQLCSEALNCGYFPVTVEDYCSRTPDNGRKTIIFRHDVDRKIGMALEMAEIEHAMNIRATYYFRYTTDVFQPEIIRKIRDLGHEIGYHYEVLDKAKGDREKAVKLFEQELSMFREIANVRTACMHGNPLAPWANRDLWQVYNFRNYGIIGEPYLSIDYGKFLYLSDTGRTWTGDYSIKDTVSGIQSGKINSTGDIIRLIQSGSYPKICLLVHPNRWSDNPAIWLKELVWQNMKNIGKRIIKARA